MTFQWFGDYEFPTPEEFRRQCREVLEWETARAVLYGDLTIEEARVFLGSLPDRPE